MNFDGYGATIREAEWRYVVDCLAGSLQGIACKGRPMRRYGEVINIEVGNRTAAWVGLDQTSGAVYVEGKGETSPDLVKAIRAYFPGHSAPRIDVKEDYDDEGAFDALQAIVRRNKGSKVKAGYVALPDDSQDGKTWAAGARGGVGYIRVYEAGKHPDRVHLGRPHWVRAELECRPHYARDKLAAATMTPSEVWGMSSWTHKVGEALTGLQLPRFEPEVRKYSFDKTTRYIANTFRRHFEEMLLNGEDVARTLQAVWEEEDEYAKRKH
jgi:hypothetical protein